MSALTTRNVDSPKSRKEMEMKRLMSRPRVVRIFVDPADGKRWKIWLRHNESRFTLSYMRKIWKESGTKLTFKQFLTHTGCLAASERRQ